MSPKENDILVETRKNGVTTLRMNLPKQLNGWTQPMMLAIKLAFKRLGTDSETKVAILTGSGPYYCAGLYILTHFHSKREMYRNVEICLIATIPTEN